MKYYIEARSQNQICMVGYENTPTWDKTKAMIFSNSSNAREWTNNTDAMIWKNQGYKLEVKNV